MRRLRRLFTNYREKTRPKAWLLVVPAVLVVAMATAAAFLAWEGFALLNRDGLETSETAAAIQGLAAALSLAVTVCLVAVTAWYAFLVNKQIRLAGPDVAVDWYIVWIDAEHPPSHGSRAPITALQSGPIFEHHTDWYLAVALTNSGNQAVSAVQVQLVCDYFLHTYVGSNYGQSCPIELKPHSSRTLYFSSHDVHAFLDRLKRLQTRPSRKVQVQVDLSSGITLKSKKVPLRSFSYPPK